MEITVECPRCGAETFDSTTGQCSACGKRTLTLDIEEEGRGRLHVCRVCCAPVRERYQMVVAQACVSGKTLSPGDRLCRLHSVWSLPPGEV